MPEISLHDDSAGWTDVILPDGALKSGMLKGLIGFQELETTVKEKPQGKTGFNQNPQIIELDRNHCKLRV